MNEKNDTKRFVPRGVRKGGTRFPRQPLTEVLPWARKLVRKTHLSPQPQDVILSGVVGNSGSVGQIRISSIKQYGFLDGDSKGYTASDLAKRYDSSPPEELYSILRVAALEPPVFRSLFDTFQGDEVSPAKLRQRASELKVHPEETEKCIENYIATMIVADLAKLDGDKIAHIVASNASNPPPRVDTKPDEGDDEEANEQVGEEDSEEEASVTPRPKARAIFNVNVNLDASLDAEKLEKQLKLLKRYGAI